MAWLQTRCSHVEGAVARVCNVRSPHLVQHDAHEGVERHAEHVDERGAHGLGHVGGPQRHHAGPEHPDAQLWGEGVIGGRGQKIKRRQRVCCAIMLGQNTSMHSCGGKVGGDQGGCGKVGDQGGCGRKGEGGDAQEPTSCV